MPNNRQSVAVKKRLPVAHSTVDILQRKKKKSSIYPGDCLWGLHGQKKIIFFSPIHSSLKAYDRIDRKTPEKKFFLQLKFIFIDRLKLKKIDERFFHSLR